MLPTPIHTRVQPQRHYTPVHPSPLSSSPLRSSPTPSPLSRRDANVPSSPPTYFSKEYQNADLMVSPTPTPKTRSPARLPSPAPTPTSTTSTSQTRERDRESGSGRETPFSRRPTKANPLLHRDAQDGREARRKLFLKRVRDNSAEKRYGGEEEIMRRIWVAEERRREEERRMEAMGVEIRVDEVEEVLEEGRTGGVDVNVDEMLVEEVARDEAAWDAFLSMVEGEREGSHQQRADTPYGSDDEEYDHIFMDVILEENRTGSQTQEDRHQQLQRQEQLAHADMDMMDMS